MLENSGPNELVTPLSPKGFPLEYILHLADNTLILSQRNSEWCAHGPVLEQDIAITNIALDLIGQARNFYQYAAALIGKDCSEDKLAFLRNEPEFKNCLLVELPKGDWAQTILRQFFFSAYQFYLYKELEKSNDSQIAAIAEKSLKEVTYHLRWSSEWVIRLGDGTDESHARIIRSLDYLWQYSGELFQPAPYEAEAIKSGIGVDPALLKEKWEEKIKEIFTEATLPYPDTKTFQSGGKEGKHTEHLGPLLAEMQYMQRTFPDSQW
jgi:ring-1,2-phenylacetyl-CoA epoxidase subunit PaaC